MFCSHSEATGVSTAPQRGCFLPSPCCRPCCCGAARAPAGSSRKSQAAQLQHSTAHTAGTAQRRHNEHGRQAGRVAVTQGAHRQGGVVRIVRHVAPWTLAGSHGPVTWAPCRRVVPLSPRRHQYVSLSSCLSSFRHHYTTTTGMQLFATCRWAQRGGRTRRRRRGCGGRAWGPRTLCLFVGRVQAPPKDSQRTSPASRVPSSSRHQEVAV